MISILVNCVILKYCEYLRSCIRTKWNFYFDIICNRIWNLDFIFSFRCQEDEDTVPAPLVQKILDILYATEVSVIVSLKAGTT